MDFFTAQSRARTQTRKFIVLFALAVLGVAAGVYLVLMLAWRGAGGGLEMADGSPDLSALWDADLALFTLLGTTALVGGASLFKWFTLGAGGPAVARMMDGRRVHPATFDPAERRLVNVVEEMALASGLPVPGIYILDAEPSINAFAAGLTPADAVVAVSRGALEQLPRDELQAVVGHEFSHILNGDMRLNLKLTAILFGILALTIVGRVLLRTGGGARGGGRDKRGNALPLIGLGLILAGYLGFFFGRLLQAAVSRQREYLADASSVQFTRNPLAMANALNRIRASTSVIQSPHAGEISHFFFAQSFTSYLGELFATHPPLPARIHAIIPDYDPAKPRANAATTAAVRAAQSSGGLNRLNGLSGQASGISSISSIPSTQSIADNPTPQFGSVAAAAAPAAILRGIGQLTHQQIERAGHLLAALPPALHAAAHEAETAPAIILALLLDPADAANFRQQTAIFDIHTLPDGLLRDTAALPPALRLTLLQIALGTLPALPLARQDALVRVAERLATADKRLSIFEYALLRLLKHHLAAHRNPRAAAVTRTLAPAPYARAAATVLTFIARAGRAPGNPPEDAFAHGIGALQSNDFGTVGTVAALPLHLLRLLPETECNFRALDAALEALAPAAPVQKRLLLTAALETASYDGEILPDEFDLLRVLATTLDCPLSLP